MIVIRYLSLFIYIIYIYCSNLLHSKKLEIILSGECLRQRADRTMFGDSTQPATGAKCCVEFWLNRLLVQLLCETFLNRHSKLLRADAVARRKRCARRTLHVARVFYTWNTLPYRCLNAYIIRPQGSRIDSVQDIFLNYQSNCSVCPTVTYSSHSLMLAFETHSRLMKIQIPERRTSSRLSASDFLMFQSVSSVTSVISINNYNFGR